MKEWTKNVVKESEKMEKIMEQMKVAYFASLQISPICMKWGAIIAQ